MTQPRPANGKIFVSSTCYDLIDVRAELKVALKNSGLTPVMSDQPDTEFVVGGDTNSIETCLVNLRDCERCIVILSQRYGPSLKGAGFDDVSATHLEYNEAIKARIPVNVYARDRLMADFEHWKKNPKSKSLWSKDSDHLFPWMLKHWNLNTDAKPNWLAPFTSSVDLCDRVLTDLGTVASGAAIRMLAAKGSLPELIVANVGGGWTITNHSKVSAYEVSLFSYSGQLLLEKPAMGGGGTFGFVLARDVGIFSCASTHLPALRLVYRISSGERICDVIAVLPGEGGSYRTKLAGRQFLGASLGASFAELGNINGMTVTPIAPVNAQYEADRRM